jgi:hypothetical protein
MNHTLRGPTSEKQMPKESADVQDTLHASSRVDRRPVSFVVPLEDSLCICARYLCMGETGGCARRGSTGPPAVIGWGRL